MGTPRWIGRPSRAVVLVAAGMLAGGGGSVAAIAVASVPDSSGVIHACVTTSNGLPITSGANIRIIDPSSQTCTNPLSAGPPQEEISWNVSGPPGKVVTLAGETFTISGIKQQGTLENVSPIPPQTSVNGKPIATLAVGSGKSAERFSVLGWSVTQSGGGSPTVRRIQITRVIDKSSPKLFEMCAKGQHIKKVVLSVRKAGVKKPLTVTLTNVVAAAYDESATKQKPTETVSFNYTKIKYSY